MAYIVNIFIFIHLILRLFCNPCSSGTQNVVLAGLELKYPSASVFQVLGSISEREEEQIIKPFALNFCGFKSSKTGYSQKRYTVHSLEQFHTVIEPGTTDNKSKGYS